MLSVLSGDGKFYQTAKRSLRAFWSCLGRTEGAYPGGKLAEKLGGVETLETSIPFHS